MKGAPAPGHRAEIPPRQSGSYGDRNSVTSPRFPSNGHTRCTRFDVLLYIARPSIPPHDRTGWGPALDTIRSGTRERGLVRAGLSGSRHIYQYGHLLPGAEDEAAGLLGVVCGRPHPGRAGPPPRTPAPQRVSHRLAQGPGRGAGTGTSTPAATAPRLHRPADTRGHRVPIRHGGTD